MQKEGVKLSKNTKKGVIVIWFDCPKEREHCFPQAQKEFAGMTPERSWPNMYGNEIPEGAVSARRAAAEMFLLNEITPFLWELKSD